MNIIPQPLHCKLLDGKFMLTPATRLYSEPDTLLVAQYLQSFLPLALPLQETTRGAPGAGGILLSLTGAQETLGQEGYSLNVAATGVELRACQPAGLFYGVQTLRQLLSPDGSFPALEIVDRPRFTWRGVMLDVGRHLFPLEFIERLLDTMALHKLNVLHWHLTEDQGWRIEIQKYPRLTEIGAQRSSSPYPSNRALLDGVPYGGFYTQDQVRRVVAYAASRFITVVPEIEMPGHSVAALASYPELGCTGGPYAVRTFWGIEDDVYCAGNEQTFTFLQDVLDEVMALFPSPIIHIGGDECPKSRWEKCPKCQGVMQANGLKDEHELQSYFIRRIAAYLDQRGRRLIGWDEILEGGLAPNASVMSWRGMEGGLQAVREGHDVVMTPTTFCYLDYYQSENREQEPPAIGGLLPLEQVYAFEPVPPELDSQQASHVLGLQGNLWTEYIATPEHAEYMLFPRATALAEIAWSPAAGRDFTEFQRRLASFLPLLKKAGVHYRPPSGPKPGWLLTAPEYYQRLNHYIQSAGLPWDIEDLSVWPTVMAELETLLGPAEGRRVLDCSCGWGRQAISLARLGWQVTATDISPSSMDFARRFAREQSVEIDFRLLDMRRLAEAFRGEFDWAVTAYALYELETDDAIQQAVENIFHALKPGGRCYLVQRDMDELMQDKPRHRFSGEKRTTTGRIICIEDWEYESNTHVIALDAFLREDESLPIDDHFRWTTETVGIRKRVLYKPDLVRFFQMAGFDPVTILPKPFPWSDVQLVAVKPA